jgi:hypothetical protein
MGARAGHGTWYDDGEWHDDGGGRQRGIGHGSGGRRSMTDPPFTANYHFKI